MRRGIRRDLRTALAGSLPFGGTLVASVLGGRRRSAVVRKTFPTVISALGLAMGMCVAMGATSAAPASAQGLQVATVTPEFPDGNSCAGATDTVSWPAQSVADLTGYEVEVYGSDAGLPTGPSSFSVPASQTSASFTVPSDIETTSLNYVEIATIVGGVVNAPFAESDDFSSLHPPYAYSFYPTDSSLGNGTVTVVFGYSNPNPNWSEATITASPGAETSTPTYSGGSSSSTLSSTFSGLTNGVAYTFTLNLTNDCGTTTTSSPALTPEDLQLVPPQQVFLPIGQPYSANLLIQPQGGSSAYQLGVESSGSVPPGMSAGATLSGIPTTLGTYSFSVTAYADEEISGGGFVYFNGGGLIGSLNVTLYVGEATATMVSSSTNPSTYGQPATFTATVSPTDGDGSVAFYSNGSSTPISGSRRKRSLK